jgi:hypothetical protein
LKRRFNILSFCANLEVSTTATWLLLLVVLHAVGWFCAGQWMYHAARRAADRQLERRETRLDTLRFATAELDALRVSGKREIRWQGRLYDIKREHASGDSTELLVFHDRDEERVLRAVAGIFGKNSAAATSWPMQWWAQWLGAVYLAAEPVHWQLHPPADRRVDVFCPAVLQTQHAPGKWAPPPEDEQRPA